jgi:type IV secretion system protein VirB9
MITAAHVLMSVLAAAPAPLPGAGASAACPQGPGGHAEIVSIAPKRRSSAPPGKRAVRPPAASVEAANRAALQEPRSDGFVDSVQVYPWTEGGIYRLYTAPGHITDIALQPGEALTAVAAGDTVRWIVGDTTSGSGASRQVHILLKPSASGLSTNLVITTDRRIYRLQAEATQRTAMAAVSWTYPGDALLALSGDTSGIDGIATGSDRDAPPFDFGYVLKGDKPSWRPLRVFNDGRQVFVEFPPGFARGEAPPLFARRRDGTTELLNYRVQGRFYVVDRLFEAAELRLGSKKQQVVRIEHRGGKAR